MEITVITPAPSGSLSGNRATAERWARLLENAGHRVRVVTEYRGEPCDVFIALHAWRSHDAIQMFRRSWPETPLVLTLTGTDIYQHQVKYPIPTRASMAAADVLIGLHHLVYQDVPEPFRSKLVTVYQSAPVIERPASSLDPERLTACVVGHLRDEKDSLRAALAVGLLPPESRVRIVAAGKPHNDEWRLKAERETLENPRFHWLGELGREKTAELLKTSDAMVISSVMEGGANVVSEACRAGLPILASDIPGNRGLLGEDYPGYFPVGDEAALAGLLGRAESDPEFLQELASQVRVVAPRFEPQREQAGLERALALAIQRRSERSE